MVNSPILARDAVFSKTCCGRRWRFHARTGRCLAVEHFADVFNRLGVQHKSDRVTRVDRDTHANCLVERLQPRHADRVRSHVDELLRHARRVREYCKHDLLVGPFEQ